jgi:hypothetical protein
MNMNDKLKSCAEAWLQRAEKLIETATVDEMVSLSSGLNSISYSFIQPPFNQSGELLPAAAIAVPAAEPEPAQEAMKTVLEVRGSSKKKAKEDPVTAAPAPTPAPGSIEDLEARFEALKGGF